MDIEPMTSHNKKFLLFSVLIVFTVLFIFAILTVNKNEIIPQVVENPVIIGVVKEIKKTDFGTSVPSDFSSVIITDKGTKIDQSYSLDFAGHNQLTIVVLSTKIIKENYTLYADFFEKQNWVILRKYENSEMYSFYATKNGDNVNVEIIKNMSDASFPSKITVTLFKKATEI